MATRRCLGGLIGLTVLLSACQPERAPTDSDPTPTSEMTDPEPTAPPGFALEPISFADVPGWEKTNPGPAISAFARTCEKWAALPGDEPISARAGYGGRIEDWMPACRILPQYQEAGELRRFFEDYFAPFIISTEEETNKLTGYYEPEIPGSREQTPEFSEPIPARPDDLIEVDLGLFDEALSPRKIWGKVDGSQLTLYPERSDIETTSDHAIGYATPADVFFMQIQGSGRVRFSEDDVIRAAFDAHNHRPFGSLANHLLEAGEISRAEAGMSGLRAWIDRVGPERAREAMNINPRFVWFREIEVTDPSEGPAGAAGLPLTAMGSLAVDLNHHPLGVPMIVRSLIPTAPGRVDNAPSNLLLVSQDTGGAITGIRRGDIFFGTGDDAGAIAGSMNQPGEFVVLLPQGLERAPAGAAP